MANSRMFFGAGLLLALVATPAFAQAQNHTAPPPPDTPAKVVAALRQYNTVENELRRAGVMDANAIAAHFRKLGAIRIRLEKLEQQRQIDPKDTELSREIMRLLDSPMQVSVVGADIAAVRLRSAQDLRLRDLVTIARLGNRHFGLGIREVLGVQLEAGVS